MTLPSCYQQLDTQVKPFYKGHFKIIYKKITPNKHSNHIYQYLAEYNVKSENLLIKVLMISLMYTIASKTDYLKTVFELLSHQ